MNVLVLPHRAIRAGAPGGEVWGLKEALTSRFRTDAHFTCYSHNVRLKKREIQDLGVRFSCAIFDLDDKAAHQNGSGRSDDFEDVVYGAQDHLSLALGVDVGMYLTRGGGRLVLPYSEPLNAEIHTSFVSTCLDILTDGGFDPDPLKDTTRLFRLPYVWRDGIQQEHPMAIEDMGEISRDRVLELVGGSRISASTPGQSRFRLPDTIGEGERNTVLCSYAGVLRNRGLSSGAILQELRTTNQQRVNPPVGDDKLIEIADWAGSVEASSDTNTEDSGGDGQGPTGEIRFTLGSEQEIADVVVSEYAKADDTQLVYDRNRIWRYGGAAWAQVEDSVFTDILRRFDGDLISSGRNADGTLRTSRLKVSSKLYSSVTNIIRINHHRRGFFEGQTLGLAFEDGFLDARRLELVENNPEHRALVSVPMTWADDRPEPRLWLETLKDIFGCDDDLDEKIDFLEEFIGVGLLGAATQLQKALILLGSGANGKSTILDVVNAIFRWSGAKVTALAPQGMENEYNRDMLAGSRLNVCNEMPEADILSGSAVKATISGDVQTARQIRESPYEFRPRALQLFAANFLPAVSDSSQGFWRRWGIITFNRTFAVHERDPFRAESIIDTEIPAIVKRCVIKGMDAMSRRRYSEPDSSIDAVNGWRTQADQVACWLSETCDVLDEDEMGRWSSPTELYESYTTWSSVSGHRAMSKNKFSRRIRELGVGYARTSRSRLLGVRVRTDLRIVK